MTYVIQCIDDNHRLAWYTGRAGEGWLSTNLNEAFQFSTIEEAIRKAQIFNRLGDWGFIALRRYPGGERIN